MDILDESDGFWMLAEGQAEALDLTARALGITAVLLDAVEAEQAPEAPLVVRALEARSELARLVEAHARPPQPEA